MFNQSVRDAFHRWIHAHVPNPKSAALRASWRVYDEMLDPLFGSTRCSSLQPQASLEQIQGRARLTGAVSASHAFQLLSAMMGEGGLWPRQSVHYEAFSPRTSVEIPLSSYDVAALITRMPSTSRLPIHLLLLTGVKPSQLVALVRSEFERASARSAPDGDEPGGLQEVNIAGSAFPIYLTIPVISEIRRHLARRPAAEPRVFHQTAASITSTWTRYAGDAPALCRYKGTAATHLLRHGADAPVLSANLGISLLNAQLLAERLAPSAALGVHLARA